MNMNITDKKPLWHKNAMRFEHDVTNKMSQWEKQSYIYLMKVDWVIDVQYLQHE